METVRFGELYAIPSGNGLSRPTAVRGEGFRMIGMGELFANDIITDMEMDRVKMSEKEKNNFFVEEGDLLFARQSLVASGAGKCSIVKQFSEPTTYESHLIRVRLDKSKCNPWFYYYLFKLQNNPIKAIINQCAQAGIRGNELIRVKVPLVELGLQNRIVSVLLAYDNLIETNNKRIKALELMAENLYKEWFVRFRFPGHETTEFENGIPKAWCYVKLGEAVTFIDGDRGSNYPTQDEFSEDGYCLFLNAGNVTKSGFDFTNCSYITKEKDTLLKKGKLNYGDVVLTTRGTVGNSAFYNTNIKNKNVRINSGMVIIREKELLSSEYIYTLLNDDYVKAMITLYSSGSAQPQLPIKDLKRIRILMPDEKTMKQFTELVKKIYDEISIVNMCNMSIIKQRDLLLPRLMSGKLEV